MKKTLIALLLLLSFLLSGCNQLKNISSNSNPSKSEIKVPKDFSISFEFGYVKGKLNSLDTVKKVLTKDLLKKGIIKKKFNISKEDLASIYSKILSNNIKDIKYSMTSKNLTKTNMFTDINPLCIYKISFTCDGTVYNITGDETARSYIQENEQASNFCIIVDYLKKYYYSTKVYKSMPEAVGGYL